MALPTRKNWRSVRAGLAIGLALAICPLAAQSSINLPGAVGAQTSPSSSNPFNDWHAGYGVSLGFRIAYSGPMKLAYSFIGRDGLTSSALTVNLTTLSAGTFDFNAVMGAQDPAPGSPPMDRSLVLSMTQTPANFLSSAVAAPMPEPAVGNVAVGNAAVGPQFQMIRDSAMRYWRTMSASRTCAGCARLAPRLTFHPISAWG